MQLRAEIPGEFDRPAVSAAAASEEALEGYDATFREAAWHQAMVSAILLVANPAKSADPLIKRLGHPDAVREGTFAMPNVTSEEGIGLYGAILQLMSERWSRPDGTFGRVHHWIMHNEVDAGWVWTNAGEKPAMVYMDLYQRSMRLMELITSQHDPHARPFITLTHHWAEPGEKRWYGSKRMIELLLAFTKAEGDFPWALAHHPYPQNLFNPRAWEDQQAIFDFNSKKITPKNLEVLDAYMRAACASACGSSPTNRAIRWERSRSGISIRRSTHHARTRPARRI